MFVSSILVSGMPVLASPIDVVSIEHDVWGEVLEEGYDLGPSPLPLSGEDQDYVSQSFTPGWVTVDSQTNFELFGDRAEIYVEANANSEGPDDVGYACAKVVLTFRPTELDLSLDFSGDMGSHLFSGWAEFVLTDETANVEILSHRWAKEGNWWPPGDTLPLVDAIDVFPSHEYQAVFTAYAATSDVRQDWAFLNTTITPEPTIMALLILGAMSLRPRSPKRTTLFA